jgi:uncharacterized protein (TIGR02246 family)
MTMKSRQATDEAQLRQIIEDWAQAVRSKDIDQLTSNYASDVLLFDVVNQLQHVGSAAVRTRAMQWIASFEGSIGYEVRDLRITTDNNVAFCHSLNGINATTKDGQKVAMWVRATVCFRKMDGMWRVTHEHSSVPFDGESGKASLNLKP